ncbi:MAG TPA: ATP-binding protein [Ramlibacter sp.]|nr:ATP-binding protein [Ramlibacter sp.]
MYSNSRNPAPATLEEERAQFEALADNISQLAWMTDPQGWIYWYNRRWYEFTGTSLQQMEGWGWKAVHHPDHVSRVEEKFRAHIASGEPWEDTFPLRAADGSYRWFLSRAFPLRGQNGKIVRWFGTNTDVTEQLAAQDALRDADRRKDEFIATLAHELRNPLAPVRNAAEILARLPGQAPAAQRMSGVIGRQIAHMARLLDDLMDVARIARGKLELQQEDCDLGEIALGIVEDYRESLTSANIELVTECPAEPLPVKGDPVRLAQAIGNYLQNAARFAQGARVTVRAFADHASNEAVIAVSDAGAGISAELLPRLFDSFAQADQGLARAKGGLGLGLALTRGLAELHGGRVAAHSAGEGQGATFELRIPLDSEHEKREPQQARGAPAMRILLIEDNRDSAETLAMILQTHGHDVRVAFDGTSGIAQAQKWRPDVVISDLGLPGAVDGYSVARALRADERTADIRLLALSGYADSQAVRRSGAAGFDAHLAKPVDFDMLIDCLAGDCAAALA